MRRFLHCFYLLLPVIYLCTVLIACSSTVPDVETVEKHFRNNYKDIQIVVDFIINSEYLTVSINNADGTMQADLETIKIEDESVNGAVKRLLGTLVKERQYYSIYKSGNTIEFHQWSGTQDVGCGIAYSISGKDVPRIEYCTDLIPLTEDSWYYYVDDYNAWCTGKRPLLSTERQGTAPRQGTVCVNPFEK